MMSELFIWWLSQVACDAINKHYDTSISDVGIRDKSRPPLPVPEYLRYEFYRLNGRIGQAWLWVHDGIDCKSIQWPVHSALADWIKDSGCDGIVCRMKDLDAVRALPGIVTDMELTRL